jgi:predicted nucleic acid-binding protein
VSFSVDANVLLYASDTSSAHHEEARRLLAGQTENAEILYIAWPVAMANLRIATHPRVFDAPLAPDEALANLRHLLALPRVRPIGEKDGFLSGELEEAEALYAAIQTPAARENLSAVRRGDPIPRVPLTIGQLYEAYVESPWSLARLRQSRSLGWLATDWDRAALLGTLFVLLAMLTTLARSLVFRAGPGIRIQPSPHAVRAAPWWVPGLVSVRASRPFFASSILFLFSLSMGSLFGLAISPAFAIGPVTSERMVNLVGGSILPPGFSSATTHWTWATTGVLWAQPYSRAFFTGALVAGLLALALQAREVRRVGRHQERGKRG